MGCHARLQGISLIQGSNPHLLRLLHCRWILYHGATGCPNDTVGFHEKHTKPLHTYNWAGAYKMVIEWTFRTKLALESELHGVLQLQSVSLPPPRRPRCGVWKMTPLLPLWATEPRASCHRCDLVSEDWGHCCSSCWTSDFTFTPTCQKDGPVGVGSKWIAHRPKLTCHLCFCK